MLTKSLEDLEAKIFGWLSAPDPSSNYNKARELCQAKTGWWFLRSKHFSDWKEEDDSFLWLYGIPGCGKTILSSTIVEDIINCLPWTNSITSGSDATTGIVVLHFYFDFNDAEKQSHAKMIRSLIVQLSSNTLSVPQCLRVTYESCANGQRQPTAETLLELLKSLIKGYQKVFLVLDALDECTKRFELLSFLNELSSWKLGASILVTSRREADIGETLDLIGPKKLCIQSNLVAQDIRSLIRDRLNNDWKLRRWKKYPAIQSEIEETLTAKAGGM
jgi:hypothetical protein